MKSPGCFYVSAANASRQTGAVSSDEGPVRTTYSKPLCVTTSADPARLARRTVGQTAFGRRSPAKSPAGAQQRVPRVPDARLQLIRDPPLRVILRPPTGHSEREISRFRGVQGCVLVVEKALDVFHESLCMGGARESGVAPSRRVGIRRAQRASAYSRV